MFSAESRIGFLHRLPSRISTRLWPFAKGRAGDNFFFSTAACGRRVYHGGIFGVVEEPFFMRLDRYERDTVLALRRALPGSLPGAILDIGGNVGAYLLFFKTLYPDSPVHCVEPLPELASLLRALMEKNGFSDCAVHESAFVADDRKQVTITYGGSDRATASISLRRSHHDKTLQVPASTVDSYVSAKVSRPISLMKIDVEGAEPEVIRGAMATLMKHRPVLILEILDGTSDAAWRARFDEMEGALRRLDYRFFLIRKGGALEEQGRVVPDPAYRDINYLVTPRNHKFIDALHV